MLKHLLMGKYQLLEQLGAGGFGQTFLAEYRLAETPQRCVVKRLQPSTQNSQFLRIARRLFESEVEALRTLGQHDQIPALLDSFEVEGDFYLVQEYIEGQSLKDELTPLTRWSEADAITLLRQVLPVLDFIHQQGVIHRDIKPDNLIRRQRDGVFVLIDFGAVKAIQSRLRPSPETALTIGIGTEGYTPSEQLAGRPRFSSDLYALGMTVLQALTGQPPLTLIDEGTSTLVQWPEDLSLSPGLRRLLTRMVQPSVYQRYNHASEVLRDLDQLHTLADAPVSVEIPETFLPESPRHWRWRQGLLTTLAVTAAVLVGRQVGGLVPLELALYDRWIRWQPPAPPDNRLLVVEITEADLRQLQRDTPTDDTLAQTIETLQQANPAVIGLDLYREIPQGDGHDRLMQAMAADNVVTIMSLGNTPEEFIPPPATIPPERVGFSDVPLDRDGIVRRHLMFASPDQSGPEEVYTAFGLQMALHYLADRGIVPQGSPHSPEIMRLRDQVFTPLTRNFGGYQGVDSQGYQILLRYRAQSGFVDRVTLGTVLSNAVDPRQVNDRIVIVGTTAPSAKDLFYTPYRFVTQDSHQMPGVVLHAQMTSQILSAVLNGSALPWTLPDWAEVLVIVCCGSAGAALGLRGRLRGCWIGVSGGVVMLLFVGFASLTAGGWVPVGAPVVALVSSALVGSLLWTNRLSG